MLTIVFEMKRLLRIIHQPNFKTWKLIKNINYRLQRIPSIYNSIDEQIFGNVARSEFREYELCLDDLRYAMQKQVLESCERCHESWKGIFIGLNRNVFNKLLELPILVLFNPINIYLLNNNK